MQAGAVYIRVSTDDQTEYSPDAQLKALLDYAKKNNIIITEDNIYKDEGISGRKADTRPAFQKMIASAKKKPKPFDIILVHKFDRFARSREDSVVYKSLLRKECGIKVVSITEPLEDDKMSVLIEALLEAMAEYYSLNLAEEVMKGLKEKAKRGERCGKSPYGYDFVNGEMVINHKEAEIVRMIFEKYKTQSQSLIARNLNYQNITTKSGRTWYNGKIQYILSNPAYKGYIRYNYKKGKTNVLKPREEWIQAKALHVPIIDEALFDETQEKLIRDSKLSFRGAKTTGVKHWLQHILRCEECGSALGVSESHGGRCAQYRCRNKKNGLCFTSGSITTKKVELAVLNTLKEDLGSMSDIRVERVNNEDNQAEIDALLMSHKKLIEQKKLIKMAYLNKVDTLDEYRENKKMLAEQENGILEEIQKIKNSQIEANDKKEVNFTNLFKLLEEPNKTSLEKNNIAKQFIKEIKFDLKTKKFQIIYYI